MADNIKLSGPSMEQRIANRLKNSGDVAHADVSVKHGSGPTRTHTQIHHSGQNKALMHGDESRVQEKDADARMYNSPEEHGGRK